MLATAKKTSEAVRDLKRDCALRSLNMVEQTIDHPKRHSQKRSASLFVGNGTCQHRFAVAPSEAGPMRAAGGIHVVVDGNLDLISEAETIVVQRGFLNP